jgi:outer membrane protein insertion porin family
LGRGQDLRLGFRLSGDKSQLDLSFTEPYFLGRDLAAGFDLFRVVSVQSESSFDLERVGGSLRAGYDLVEQVRQVWRYTLQQQEITDVEGDASSLIKDDEGTRIESSIRQSITYDTRNSRFDPREGFVMKGDVKVAGLGGDIRHVQTTLGGGYFYTFLDDVTIGLQGEVGNVIGLGQDTKVSDRFFKGGSTSLRGFEPSGIGPRDRATGDSLAGKNFYTGAIELSFPLGLPDEFDIRGRIFTDFGALWDIDGSTVGVDDSTSPRLSIGTGISWVSPLGPMVLDLAVPMVKESFDNTEFFHFSFGTRF